METIRRSRRRKGSCFRRRLFPRSRLEPQRALWSSLARPEALRLQRESSGGRRRWQTWGPFRVKARAGNTKAAHASLWEEAIGVAKELLKRLEKMEVMKVIELKLKRKAKVKQPS